MSNSDSVPDTIRPRQILDMPPGWVKAFAEGDWVALAEFIYKPEVYYDLRLIAVECAGRIENPHARIRALLPLIKDSNTPNDLLGRAVSGLVDLVEMSPCIEELYDGFVQLKGRSDLYEYIDVLVTRALTRGKPSQNWFKFCATYQPKMLETHLLNEGLSPGMRTLAVHAIKHVRDSKVRQQLFLLALAATMPDCCVSTAIDEIAYEDGSPEDPVLTEALKAMSWRTDLPETVADALRDAGHIRGAVST